MARGASAGGWHLGVIGGSGLYDPGDLDEVQQIAVASPFGAPSSPVTMGSLGGVKVTFLARHGADHTIPPGAVNYRANIDVLKRCGVTDVIALSAVGFLSAEIAPGSVVAIDQVIDQTHGRERSFFAPGIVAQVGFADPICARLAGLAAGAAEKAGAAVRRGGCYVAIDGPRFPTRAEGRLFKAWGGDVVGMTAMPEASLAREAELPYALLGMVSDFASWQDGEPPVAGTMLANVARNAAIARTTLRELVKALPRRRAPVPADTALEGAIVTPRGAWDPQVRVRLDAVARRVLRSTPGG